MKNLLLLPLVLLSACTIGPVANDPQLEYTQANVYKNLELPPDLTIEKSSAYNIPGIDELKSAVPDYQDAKLVRSGGQTWLEVTGDVDLIWKRLHNFLNLNGIEIEKSDRLTGIIKSSWLNNQTGITAGNILDSLQANFISSNYSDQFVISVEPSAGNKVKVVILHNGLAKVVLNDKSSADISEKWVKTGANKSLELTLLKKFMAYSGLSTTFSKKGYKTSDLNDLFKDKVFKKNNDDHFILVRKPARHVFSNLQKKAFSLFDVENVTKNNRLITIKHEYDSVLLEKKSDTDKKEVARDLIRIQVVKLGYDSKIIIRNNYGESIDLKTTDLILNQIFTTNI